MTRDEFQNLPPTQRLKAALFKKRIKNGQGVYGCLTGRIQDAREAFADLSYSFPTTDESLVVPLRPTWEDFAMVAITLGSWIGGTLAAWLVM